MTSDESDGKDGPKSVDGCGSINVRKKKVNQFLFFR